MIGIRIRVRGYVYKRKFQGDFESVQGPVNEVEVQTPEWLTHLWGRASMSLKGVLLQVFLETMVTASSLAGGI